MRVAIALFALLVSACTSQPGDAPLVAQTGGMCGGFVGIQCGAEGDYCASERGVCANVADYAGVCKPIPKFCTREYRPVCGCDGETYPSGCSAAANGVSVASEGACIEGD